MPKETVAPHIRASKMSSNEQEPPPVYKAMPRKRKGIGDTATAKPVLRTATKTHAVPKAMPKQQQRQGVKRNWSPNNIPPQVLPTAPVPKRSLEEDRSYHLRVCRASTGSQAATIRVLPKSPSSPVDSTTSSESWTCYVSASSYSSSPSL